MEDSTRIKTFEKFWPYYMSQHRKRGTRFVHFIGTSVALFFVAEYFATSDWRLLPIALVTVYGPAFLSHFIIEKNRPATFKYPFLSIGGDLKMWFLMLTGKIKI